MRGALLGIGAVAMIATPLGAQSNGDAGAIANWRAVEACAQQTTPEARHACIDRVLRGAGLLTPQREVAEQEESFGLSASQRTQSNALPVREETEIAEVEEIAEVDAVTSAIAFARFVGRNRLLVVTENGAVWRQTSSERIRRLPSVGTDFRASTAALGGFRCRIGSSTSFRCERLD